MYVIPWMMSLLLGVQVPAPSAGQAAPAELAKASRAIQEKEAKELAGLAEGLAGKGDARSASEVRRVLAPERAHGVASRLAPLPEVVSAQGQGLASVTSGAGKAGRAPEQVWRGELERIRSQAAAELFALAGRAAALTPPQYGQAAMCLRGVLERQPDHAEARRLLGYVRHDGGWARPFAVRQLKEGNVNHPVFGWVPADWVAHLEAGELPAPMARGQKKPRWLPAREADELRSHWKNPWVITTEHFEIKSDVPLAEVIVFARRLEAFYDLFFTLMGDVVGDNLPLARRFRTPSLTGEATYRAHQVDYFASKDEYIENLKSSAGTDLDESLGYYNPPRPGKGNRAPAHFFRDPGGQLPVTATLYHEVSHQLLFETAGPNGYTKNAGNYWVFEGLGTYFETVTPQADGSLEVGGLVGERITAARQSLTEGRFLPLDQFLLLDQNRFNQPDRIRDHYQQAMALTVFLMQWKDEIYREAFLDYVRDAYRGRIKLRTGRSLEDRVGEPVRVLETQFRDFLARGDAVGSGGTGLDERYRETRIDRPGLPVRLGVTAARRTYSPT